MLRIKRGLDVPISGAPQQSIEDGPAIRSVALLGPDYAGMKPNMAVQVGDIVRRGQALFHDRRNEGVSYTAPAGGRVSAIHRGAKRALLSVVIDVGEDEAEPFQAFSSEEIERMGRQELQSLLLRSGLWTALRTRPFSLVPTPDSIPAALFINAMDSEPLAANPEVIINTYKKEFTVGINALEVFPEENTYICKAAGADIPVTEKMEAGRGVYVAEFAGPHPAGLAETHIHFIAPAGQQRTVWSISYQDVEDALAAFAEALAAVPA